MRILDIDLDLFVDEPAYWKSPGQRLSPDEYTAWPSEKVRSFLEKQCGLSRARPIPGRVVNEHHEAFFAWRELVDRGWLHTPFEVVHADSHADLGMGDAGWFFLMGEHLHRPVLARTSPPVASDKLGAGNYLVFAVACRWLSKLTYVHHPSSGDDLLAFHFKDFNPSTNMMELKRCNPQSLDRLSLPATYASMGVEECEPVVPFRMVPSTQFVTTKPFDMMVLARSPEFTPPQSDALIPLIQEYMIAI